MATIAVSGATGNLGGLIIDELVASDVDPRGIVPLVRSAEKAEPFTARGMAPRVASFEDPDGYRAALRDVETLVLISSPSLDNAERLQQLHGAVMAAHAAGIGHLAWVGLADPEERAFGLEDVDLAIEHSIRATGIPFTFLRNSTYLDELGSELAVAAASGELVSATEGRTLNWAPRVDQAAAIAAAVTSDGHLGKTYNLVSPEPYTFDDVAAALSEATGRSIRHRPAAPAETITALVTGGMDHAHAESMVTLFHASIATGKCRTTGTDIARLAGRTGRMTAEHLRQILERTAAAS